MTRARLAVALIVTTLASVACRRSTERDRVDFERMRRQQRYDLYGASGVFANHASMQAPPAGTITRESRGDTGVIGSGMLGGREVAVAPLPITPARLAVGEQKFAVYCAVCHGAAGFGGSIVAENMGPPRPPSLRSAAMLVRPAGYIFSTATHGKGRMPSYAAQLTPEERWAVVMYVERLQRTPPVTADAINDSTRALAIARIDSIALQQQRR